VDNFLYPILTYVPEGRNSQLAVTGR